jgi:glycosyltransferase involved in cell wall biosynthesis
MPRNVLQLVGSFHQGGSERQAAQLTRLLAESGRYRVRVACLNPEGVLRAEVERLNLGEIHAYPLDSFYDRRFVAQLRRFAAFLRAESVDLVQTHDFYSNVFGMAGAALARVPARVAAKRETGGMRSAAQRRVELLSYRLARAVVANSEAVKRQLVGDGVPARKVAVVYNGLDPARVRPPADFSRAEALAGLGLPAGGARRFVTLVANLRHAVKDHPTFLRAARRVREEFPEAAFVLAGEGELEAPLRALCSELRIAEAVFFTGRCTRVGPLLAASDVCVLSSTAEGFSNSILEYMAAGRPVVATDVGGAREAVVEGETGHLVPAGDDERMAARIGGLLRDPGRAREMGARGSRRVAEQFSCAAQLARTEALYERLLAPAGVGAGEVAGSEFRVSG